MRESPEIAAVVLRVGEAWGSRDFETYSNQISTGAHFRGIGTDAEEYWASAEEFLNVRRAQSEDLKGLSGMHTVVAVESDRGATPRP